MPKILGDSMFVKRRESINLIDGGMDEAAKIMEWDDEAVLLLRNVDDGTMFFRSVVG